MGRLAGMDRSSSRDGGLPFTSTSSIRSLLSAEDGNSLLERSRSLTSEQFLRAVATTGRVVRAKSCCAKAKPMPREAGVTRAKPFEAAPMVIRDYAVQLGESK